MAFFDFMRRKKDEVKKTPEQKSNIEQVKLRHQRRIDNLLDEARVLSEELSVTENDVKIDKSKKVKISDTIVRRLTFIQYEVGIRENLISWL